MPILSYYFHLQPSEIWGLTMPEFESYMAALKEIKKTEDG